jgi:hypothetical protein
MFAKLLHDPPARWLMPAIPVAVLAAGLALPARAAPTPIQLPELPTAEERLPDLYDKYGCEVSLSPKEKAVCRAEKKEEAAIVEERRMAVEKQLLRASPEELNGSKNLRGFSGPYYTPMPTANAVVVLPETVTTTAALDGSFTAVGLVRNEIADQMVSAVTVRGELIGVAGQVLSKITTQALVEPIRPGEPAPFQLSAPVSFNQVADVRWTVDWSLELDKAKGGYRDVEAGPLNWGGRYPSGNRERTHWDTRSSPPFPYLEEGDVENLSSAPIPNPKMVVAWYEKPKESSGRIVAILTSPLFELSAVQRRVLKTLEAPSITTGRASYAILLENSDLARRIENGELQRMFWVTGE